MVSIRNRQLLLEACTDKRELHYGLRKLTVGVASVLLGTTFWFGGQAVVHADVAAPSAGVDNQTSESSNVQQPFSNNTNNGQANIERTNNFAAVHPQSVSNLAAGLTQSLIQENNQTSFAGVTAGKVDGNAILPENSNSSYYSTIKLKDDTYLNTNGSAKTYVNIQYKNQVDGSIVQHGVVTVGSDGRLTYQAPAGYQMVNVDQLPAEVRTDSNGKLHYYLSNGHETTDANLVTSQVIPADNRLAPQTETDSVSSNVQRSELRQAIHFDSWALSTNVPTVKFNSQTTTDYVSAAKAGDQFMRKYNLPNNIGNQNMSNRIDSAKVTGSGVIATATFVYLGQTYYTDAQGRRTQIGKIVRTYYDMAGRGRLGIFVSSMKLSDENNHSPFYSNLVLFDGAKAVSFKTDYYDLYGNKINLPDNEDIFAMTNMAIDNFRGNDGRNHSRNYRGVIETSGTTVVGMPRTTHRLNYTYSTDPRKTIVVVGGSNHGVRVGLLNTDTTDQNLAPVGSDSGNIFSQAYQLDNQVPYDHIRQVTAKRTINFLTDSVLGAGDKDALSDPVVQTIVWTGFEKNGRVVAGDLQQAKQFPAYQLPVIDGYHPEQITEVPAESLNPNQDNGAKSYNGVYNVFYSRPEQISTVTVPVIQNGAHWTVKPGEVDPSVMHGVDPNSLVRDVTRTITVTNPDKSVKTYTQKAHFTRNAEVDMLTNKIKFDNWMPASVNLAAINLPTIAGYAPDKTIDAVVVTPDTKDSMVNVSYVAQNQSFKVNYVDVTNNQVVKSDVINGKTDETVNVTFDVPAGYQLVSGQHTPSSVTLKSSDNADITVKVSQKVDTLDPNKPSTWPSGVKASDFRREIVYSISTSLPNNGGAMANQTTVDFTRDVNYNEATKQIVYGPWSNNGKATLMPPTFKAISGYKMSKTFSPVDVTPDSQKIRDSFDWLPEDQSFKINYVDVNNSNQPVKTDVIKGKTDQTVNLDYSVPTHYVLMAGQDLPKAVTMKANGNSDIVVKVVEATTDFSSSTPEGQLPAGVHHSDFERTVQRDVHLKQLDGTVKPLANQLVVFTRTATYNQVTGKLTFASWSENGQHTFPKVDAPQEAGYQVVGPALNAETVTPDTKSQSVTLNYEPLAWNFKEIFVDTNAGNKVVKTVNLNGKTGETVTLDQTLPDGYQLAQDETLPANVTISVDGQHDVTVRLAQKVDTLDPNNSKTWPVGVTANDFKRTINRTILVIQPDGTKRNQTQTVTFVRNVKYNEVTKQLTYDPWSENGSHQFAAVTAPVIAGYQADKSAEAVTVTPDSKDSAVEINYIAQAQSFKINYVDVTANNKLVKSDVVNGKTDQTVNVNINVPAGYQLVANQNLPKTVKLAGSGNADLIVKLMQKVDVIDPNDPNTWPNGLHESDLKRVITRDVKITDPDGKVNITHQMVIFVRGGNYNEITKQVVYDPWSEGGSHQFAAVTAPVIVGYQPNKSAEAITVTPDSKDSTVEINYIAQAQSFKINYVDVTEGSKLVKIDIVNGKTDQTVNVNINVPAGYQLVANQNLPKTVKLAGSGNADLTVKLMQKVDVIDPNNSKTWPVGVTANDFKRTINRTIVIIHPDGTKRNQTQTVTFVRDGNYNEITKQVAYDPWSEGGSHQFAAVTAPVIVGYQPNKLAEAITVTPDSKDSTVEINYIAQAQSFKINYVDVTEGSKLVKIDVVNGKTDQTVNVNINVPAGYQLVENQSLPKTVKLSGSGNADLTVKLIQKIDAIDPNDPNTWPNGLHESDLKRVITRVINITEPGQTTNTITQVAKIFRNAKVNDVTGEVTYGAWSMDADDWTAVTIPEHEGYTVHQSDGQTGIPMVTVKDGQRNVTIDVTYTADNQSIVANFIDQNGHMVATKLINGKTGQTVDVANFLPDGWVIYSGQKVPTKITFGTRNNNCDFIVSHLMVFVASNANVAKGDPIDGTQTKTYPAGVSAMDLNKAVTRTINVTMPSGAKKTVIQSVHFMRNAVVDAVTGEVNYFGWSENGSHLFAGYVSSPIDGYKVDGVKSLVVTPDSQDFTVDVTYVPVVKTITINYKTADGKLVSTVTDVKADKDGNIQLIAPAGYVLSTNVDKVKLADSKDNVYDVMVRTDSHVVTFDDVNLPAAVSKDNLKKTVSRAITIIMLNGRKRTIKQTVTFVRTANVDSKGVLLGYNEWQATGRVQFNSVFIPKRAGYTLRITDTSSNQSLNKIAKVAVTPDMANDTITVSYAKN